MFCSSVLAKLLVVSKAKLVLKDLVGVRGEIVFGDRGEVVFGNKNQGIESEVKRLGYV